MASVPDAPAVATAVFPSLPAPVAPAAGAGQQGYHAVSGLNSAHARPHFLHDSGNLVAQYHTGRHSPAEDPGHDQPVVMAEPTGCHSDQSLAGFRARRGKIHHRQAGRRSGTFQHQRAHGQSL